MDLTLFIISCVFIGIIYYLIVSIQSLVKEMREIKTKCIHTRNSTHEDFKVVTDDPGDKIKSKAMSILKKLQYIVD
jgi:hypothetical protein